MNIRIKRLHPDAVIPTYAKHGDSGFDLVATEDVIIAPGETALVPTGLAFEIPVGYELQIRPRSGVSLKTKLRVANTPGTVDSPYRGEVKVIVDNIAQLAVADVDLEQREVVYWENEYVQRIDGTDEKYDFLRTFRRGTYLIRKGDRIAQGVIAPVVHANLIETDDDLTETGRGGGGFGHTGITVAEMDADLMRKAFEAKFPSMRDYIDIELDDE